MSPKTGLSSCVRTQAAAASSSARDGASARRSWKWTLVGPRSTAANSLSAIRVWRPTTPSSSPPGGRGERLRVLHLPGLAGGHAGDHVDVARRPVDEPEQAEGRAADGDEAGAISVSGEEFA